MKYFLFVLQIILCELPAACSPVLMKWTYPLSRSKGLTEKNPLGGLSTPRKQLHIIFLCKKWTRNIAERCYAAEAKNVACHTIACISGVGVYSTYGAHEPNIEQEIYVDAKGLINRSVTLESTKRRVAAAAAAAQQPHKTTKTVHTCTTESTLCCMAAFATRNAIALLFLPFVSSSAM